MKHVLITGGNGFIGRNLIHHLQEKNSEVNIVVIDNYSTSEPKNRIKGVKYLKLDTWNIHRIIHLQFDTVFHFGEYSRIATSFEDVMDVMQSNLYGTSRIIEACKIWDAKLIYSASSSKFGNNGLDENISPYAWSKAKIVELIKNYHKWFGLQYEICYFYNVYGEGQLSKGRFATVIGIWEEQYKNNEPITVRSPGTQKRSFTDVKDIVDGVVRTVFTNRNHEWYFKAKNTYTLNDVALMFSINIKFLPSVKGDRKTATEPANDTIQTLGWTPKGDIKAYIKKFKS